MASIRKRGNAWQARVKLLGTEAAQSFKTKFAAERWARQTEVQIELGEYKYPALMQPRVDEIRFAALVERYAKEVATTHRSQTSQVNLRTLHRDLGHMKLEEIEPKRIAAWRDQKLKHIKPASVNRLIGTLGSVLNHARKEWQLPLKNPIPNIKRPNSGHARTRRFISDEEERLLSALDTKYAQVVRFAVSTGMRRGEILHLEWKWVDIDRRVAQLAITKNGDPRTVPLSSDAITVLKEIASADFWPIHGRVFDVKPVALDKGWRRACMKTGITDLRFHDIRHEAISRFFEMGLNVMEVSAISGHRTLSQLKRYTHLRASDLVTKLS